MKFIPTVTMLPLMVGLNTHFNVNQATNIAFNENQIRDNLLEMDLNTLNYIRRTDDIVRNKLHLQDKFDKLYSNWLKQTLFLSRADQIIANKNFQGIVQMGEDAIPFILIKLNQRPSPLVWALNLITNYKISRNELTLSEASRAWIKWGLSNHLINENDLFLGN